MEHTTAKIISKKSIGVKNVVNLYVHKNHTFINKAGIVTHNCNSTMPALRNFIEEYSNNAGFILTCNYRNKILPAIQSRCAIVEFSIPKDEKTEIAKSLFDRCCFILTKENIEFDKKVVAEVIKQFFPDFRRIINELQRYSASGKIDSGILANMQDINIKHLIGYIKDKNFTELRRWIGENKDLDANKLFRRFFDVGHEYFDSSSIPQLILHIADHQYKAAFCADAEINLVAFFIRVMVDCKLK